MFNTVNIYGIVYQNSEYRVKYRMGKKLHVNNIVRRDLGKTLAKNRQIWYPIRCIIFSIFLLRITQICGLGQTLLAFGPCILRSRSTEFKVRMLS